MGGRETTPFEEIGCPARGQTSSRSGHLHVLTGHLASAHLFPSHFLAAASALARSSAGSSASCLSSSGSPLPAVFATRCHLKPSTLSTGAPMPLISTQASRF